MQNTEKEREEELRRKEQEQQQANEEEALPHEQRSVFSGDSDDRLERFVPPLDYTSSCWKRRSGSLLTRY